MGMTMRVSLPGYDCLVDGTIDHYSIYADSDNVLIKEFTRGTINASSNFGTLGSGTVTHGLGYIPYALVAVNVGGTFHTLTRNDFSNSFYDYSIGTNNIIFNSNVGTAIKTFYYYIFYDKGTAMI